MDSIAKHKKKLGIYYEPDLFPAVTLVTTLGTCVIFASGKVNFVGAKSIENLHEILSI
jgi:TATA-box binding protein (TBP) (component of TFIID and TFIIIB)